MENNTFGDSKTLKMLPCLTETINKLEKKHRNYLSSFISRFNQTVQKVRWIKYDETKPDKFVVNPEDKKLINYLLDLVHTDYKNRTDEMLNKYPIELVTYLKNYINARIEQSKL